MSDTTPLLDAGSAELLVDHPSQTGEGPLWHAETQSLIWVDIPAGQIFRFDPATGRNILVFQHDGQIGGYTIQEDGSLIIFCERGKILRLTGEHPETIVERIDALANSRFNDVIADPEGRVFAGTMPRGDQPAQLYRLDRDGSLSLVLDDLTLANGMGFSPDLSIMYLTDSNSRRIYRLQYDRSTGQLGDRSVFMELDDDNGGVPDGITVDIEGNIWSARWDGSGIYKYNPQGELLGKVLFPVRKVSSITFGGPEFSVAYVTTAGGEHRGEAEGPLAGSLFRVDLKTRGRAPFRSRIGL